MTGTFWAVVAMAALYGCNCGGSQTASEDAGADVATDIPVGAMDGPDMTGDTAGDGVGGDAPGPATAAPTGPPEKLVLNTPVTMDPGSHCGRTVVYFDPAHASSYALDLNAGGAIHATSNELNMINASVYCTFTLPPGTNSLVFRRGSANVRMDPTNMFPAASGGGLGFLIYLGTDTPRGDVNWGDYGKPVLSRWKSTRPDWNRDLAAEDASVMVPTGTTTATFAVYFDDAWSANPIEGDVVSTSVLASSAPLTADAGAAD